MKPLNVVYWSRVGFGVVAALICTFLIDVNRISDPLINGLSIGLLVFLITYYLFKWMFKTRLETPSKVFTMGIGAYFLTWIVAWVLFLTILQRPPL